MEVEPLKAEPPKRKRRWYQFNLRSLMIGVLIAAVACSFLGRKVQKKHRESAAFDWIRQSGGQVVYDYQWTFGNYARSNEPSSPWWARKILGENLFNDIDSVAVVNPVAGQSAALRKVTQEDLEHLNCLSETKVLLLNRTSVGDDDLRCLDQLTRLEELNLSTTLVTGVGLARNASFHSLETLSFKGSKLSDAGLACVQALPKLKRLDISRTQIHDAGLSHLVGLAELHYLSLARDDITDAAVKHLTRLPGLYLLDLKSTGITDAGAAAILNSLPKCKILR